MRIFNFTLLILLISIFIHTLVAQQLQQPVRTNSSNTIPPSKPPVAPPSQQQPSQPKLPVSNNNANNNNNNVRPIIRTGDGKIENTNSNGPIVNSKPVPDAAQAPPSKTSQPQPTNTTAKISNPSNIPPVTNNNDGAYMAQYYGPRTIGSIVVTTILMLILLISYISVALIMLHKKILPQFKSPFKKVDMYFEGEPKNKGNGGDSIKDDMIEWSVDESDTIVHEKYDTDTSEQEDYFNFTSNGNSRNFSNLSIDTVRF